MSELNVGTLNVAEGVQMPAVTSGNRPSTPVTGALIYNTQVGAFEKWTGSAWVTATGSSVVATGGTIFYIPGYKIHKFSGDGTFTMTTGGEVEYLIVAGGGGGGSTGDIQAGGGGGAGGYLEGKITLPAGSYGITVGGGGASGNSANSWDGYNGANSSAFGLTAIGGGGGGGRQDRSGRPGGSGGGRASGGGGGNGADGTAGQGNRGGYANNFFGNPDNISPYNASGGGGAGDAGMDSDVNIDRPAHGGNGKISLILGIPQYFAGGGGAGQRNQGTRYGSPGFGGGGTGYLSGRDPYRTSTPGKPNSGGGGGGGPFTRGGDNGGDGGSGIVIVRYRLG